MLSFLPKGGIPFGRNDSHIEPLKGPGYPIFRDLHRNNMGAIVALPIAIVLSYWLATWVCRSASHLSFSPFALLNLPAVESNRL